MVELDVKKMVKNKPNIKRLEIEYDAESYIIINFLARVIDVNGILWEYTISEETERFIHDSVWDYEEIDEFDYWPDKTKDHAPISPLWRMSWYDEYDTYFHKSGALKYPDKFNELIEILSKLQKK